MSDTQYNLAKLWPNFSEFLEHINNLWPKFTEPNISALSGYITTPGGISALIVLILFVLFGIFAFLSVFHFFKSHNQLRFYRQLLNGLSVEQLGEKRRDILKQAEQNKAYFDLWREFDESLVYISSRDRLCNTLEAEHFFNTHTIARRLTENRLLAAVPGFLTAIGVIGTFAGLQMGLAALNVSSEDFNILKQGIAGLIGGASIAFMTSVWGVITSVVFNFFEKLLERSIRTSISNFQNQVDYLYPRITAEQSLTNIEDFSKHSLEKLAELDEKIGHKMQEAMQQASDSIRLGMEQSLTTILGPAIDKLVDNAHNGSEKALESLLERFLEGVGKAGDNQREMMDAAAANIGHAANDMSNGLSSFASQLDGQINSIVTKNAEVMADIEGMIRGQLESQQQIDTARQSQMNEQLSHMQGSHARLTEGLDNVLQTQQTQNETMTNELSSLVNSFTELTNSHRESSAAMQLATTDMKASSNQLGLLSTNLKDTTNVLSSQLDSMLDKITQSSEENTKNISTVGLLAEQLQQLQRQLQETANTMNTAAEKAENGLTAVDKHFNQLMTSLEEHVAGLNKQVAQLLEDFATRVKDQTVDRMTTWNEQTTSYIGAMTDAVRTIGTVVDEIDGKVSSNRPVGNY